MRNTLGGRAAALSLILLTVGACADPDQVREESTAPPPAPVVTASTAPVTAAPGACAWRWRVDEAEPGAGAASESASGDAPPNHGDNRRWRRREGVTAPQAQVLADLVRRTRTILTEACRRGDFSPARIQQELSAIAPADGTAWTTQRVSASGEPSTAVDGYVQVGSACLVVTLEPEQVMVESTTVIADGGCWEPPAH